tara:strand:+ start:6518 stop:6964 length:447 start_codon:yes stop_codon:yes gene_type:complete
MMGVSNAFVVFKNSENWLMQYLLEENFSHVAMILYYLDQWIVVDPAFDSVKTIFGVGELDHYLDLCLEQGQTIVKIDYQCENEFSLIPWPRMMTCVSMIKAVLGIGRFCLTPKGLYKQLINHYKGEIYGRQQLITDNTQPEAGLQRSE